MEQQMYIDKGLEEQLRQQAKKIYYKKKYCKLCAEGIKDISYKDIDKLREFLLPSGKILSRKQTGTCARHQKKITKAIKIARILALLPFTER